MSGGENLLGGGEEESRIRVVTQDLIGRFDRPTQRIPAKEVESEMHQAVNRYSDARIREFVPILAEKDVRATLHRRAFAD